MDHTPTFVIGVGGMGVDVISALHDRLSTTEGLRDHVGLLAIDSDPQSLDRLTDVSTLRLRSDSGPVGETIGAYPFLSEDVRVLDGATDGRRHVGRYKLDNPAQPSFQTHLQSLRRELEQFFSRSQARFEAQSQSHTVVLVSSLMGGTGSGTFPLLAALLDQAITPRLETDGASVRCLGIGIVPSLDATDGRSVAPTDAVSYLNTYASLRNLTTLLTASDEQERAVPVYSDGPDATDRDAESGVSPGRTFSLTEAPFDAFWLVSPHVATRTAARGGRDDASTTAVLADTVLTLPSSVPNDGPLWAPAGDVSPLGTVGYAAVTVPQQSLREFCQLTDERADVTRKLDRVIDPKLTTLEERLDELEAALGWDAAELSGTDHLDRLALGIATDPERVLDIDLDTIESAFDDVASADDPEAYYRTALAFEWLLSHDVRSGVEREVRAILTRVRERYAVDLSVEYRSAATSLTAVVDAAERELDARRAELRRSLDSTGTSVRDFVPPTHDLFTSDRERLDQTIDALDDDSETLSDARERLHAVEKRHALAERKVSDARERLRRRIDECERELSYFTDEAERWRRESTKLDRDIAALRSSLTETEHEGPVVSLPLSWDALADITTDTLDTELTSLRDFWERGLIALDEDELRTTLQHCYETSRDWATPLARHDLPTTPEGNCTETTVLYHEANDALTAPFRASLTEADGVQTSTEGVAHSERPLRIEFVSVSHGGTPDTLTGFGLLESMRDAGLFEAGFGSYRDFRRALAYPEWYGGELDGAFE